MGSEAVDNGAKRAEHGDKEAVRQGYEVNAGTVGKKIIICIGVVMECRTIRQTTCELGAGKLGELVCARWSGRRH